MQNYFHVFKLLYKTSADLMFCKLFLQGWALLISKPFELLLTKLMNVLLYFEVTPILRTFFVTLWTNYIYCHVKLIFFLKQQI